jgi:hypothetical protein
LNSAYGIIFPLIRLSNQQMFKSLIIVSFLATFFTTSLAQLIISPVQQVSTYYANAEEVSLVINPLKQSEVAAGANTALLYYSKDRGQTWNGDYLQSSFGVYGDPTLTADSKGNIYFAHLSEPSSGYFLDRLVIQKSIDGGKTYSNGSYVTFGTPTQQDKPTIVCDPSPFSPRHDNLYLSWTEFDKYQSTSNYDSSRIVFSLSSDGGEIWSKPIVVSDSSGDCSDLSTTDEGAVCATAPNGDIYITWSGPDGLMFDKSIDGGKSFGKDKKLQKLTPGWEFPVKDLWRCGGFPTTLCDISNSQFRGNLYVVFSDKRNGETNSDIFLLRSTDSGESWDSIIRINNDTTKFEQYFPAATIDQTTGFIYCLFYDRRNTKGSSNTDMFLARSIDGGSSFQNFKLTNKSFASPATAFLGDYISIAANGGYVYPIWSEEILGNTALFMSRVLDTSVVKSIVPTEINSKHQEFSFEIFSNPAHSQLHCKIIYQPHVRTEIKVVDVTGKVILFKSVDEQNFSYPIDWLTNGVYYCIAQSGSERKIQKLIISH